ncbi:MAG: WbqC family protein [Flavobacteriia bacterium]|nr:WbqC family protein [Flavobacteriia bacterium]
MHLIFPTSYFGNINYYSELIKCNTISIESKEHIQKQSYRNRCDILTSNGVQQLSIPLIRKNGSKTVIDEVEISPLNDWRKDHWKAIESAYSSSVYFDFYGLEIEELIYDYEPNLLLFNQKINSRIQKWLGIETQIQFTNTYIKQELELDLREILSSKKQEKKNNYKTYFQVFNDKFPFTPNLSILDVICNLGPMARNIIQ